MNKQYNLISTSFLALVYLGILGMNPAQADDASKMNELGSVKISLIDAIKAAEQKTGGKAIGGELENESGQPQFEIDVVKDSTIHEVTVDAKTGGVLEVSLDD